MKKFIPLVLVAAGAAAYLLTRKKKENEPEEVKIITLNPEEESVIETEEEETLQELPEADSDYPYLTQKFIDDTNHFAENFDIEYPEGTAVRVNHVMKFEHVEDLIAFVKLARENDYMVQEAQEENTILVITQSIVANGTILAEVLEIANQVYCLNGEYLGFRVDQL